MLKDLPVEEFGPDINIREYSFLENPYMPQEVNASNLEQNNVHSVLYWHPHLLYRWKIHGLMCISVKKDRLVVVFQTAQIQLESSSSLSEVQRKR